MDILEAIVPREQPEEYFLNAFEELSNTLMGRLAELQPSLKDTETYSASGIALDDQTSDRGESSAYRQNITAVNLDNINSALDAPEDQPEALPGNQTEANLVPNGMMEPQHYSTAYLKQSVLNTIRNSLVDDPYILDSADMLKFPEDKRMVMGEKDGNRFITFYLMSEFFEAWIKRQEECVGTKYTPRNSPYAYSTKVAETSTQRKKDMAGQIVHRYSCHCKSKKYEIKNRVKGGKSGKTRERLPSIMCNCQASITATFRPKETSDGIPGNTYKIDYYFLHNHLVTPTETIGKTLISDAIKKRIRTMLMKGMSINAIMEHLTVDHAKFSRLVEGNEDMALSADNSITYDDVYNILHAITAKEIRKENDEIISARLWMEELDRRGYFTFYDKEGDLYHGFSSPWQLDQLRKWGDMVCFDGTHHIRGKDTYLFSLVVKNKDAGIGIPVAFLLTKTQKWEVLKEWLLHLKAKMDVLCEKPYFPNIVLTDQSQNEINAIHQAFDPHTRIFFCAWHVLQAWERNLTNQNLNMDALTNEQRKERKERVRSQLKGILYAPNVEEADTLLNAFRFEWQDEAPGILRYLDKKYLSHETDRKRWLYCFREQVTNGHINTNNYVEGWHNTLKKYLFKNKQQRRLDDVIHTLAKKADPHYQQMCIRHQEQIGKMTPVRERAFRAKMDAIDYIERIKAHDPGKCLLRKSEGSSLLQVQSFTTPNISYDVVINWEHGIVQQFHNCTCPAFMNDSAICKHIALVAIAFPNIDLNMQGAFEIKAEVLNVEPRDDQSNYDVSSSTGLTDVQIARSYVDALMSSLSIMDNANDIPNKGKLFSSLKRVADLFQESLPEEAIHDLQNKRQRQQH